MRSLNKTRAPEPLTDELAERFEERAENIRPQSFLDWTEISIYDQKVLRSLTSTGPKLLSGPRGCGKSTLLLLARGRLLERPDALPVYVHFGRSMFLEPAFGARADAEAFFQDWLTARILQAFIDALGAIPDYTLASSLGDLKAKVDTFIVAAESNPRLDRANLFGPVALTNWITNEAALASKRRIVLLLDDAVQAFVPEQQRIFFEYLRNLKTDKVTYKAAIYSGYSEFGPNFHPNQDAKIVQAWIDPDSKEYLESMQNLFLRRVPEIWHDRVGQDFVEYFALASFGIPRAFLTMIENYVDDLPRNPGALIQKANAVILQHWESVNLQYSSLEVKLPRFERYIAEGKRVQERIISQLAMLNGRRVERSEGARQATVVALRETIDPKLLTILNFFEYAGIVRKTQESVSLGAQGSYSKFALNGSLLLAENALAFGKNPSVSQRVSALQVSVRTGSYKRLSSDAVFPPSERDKCQLNLGNCSNCGQPRLLENARFCPTCGSELVPVSRLKELLSASIVELGLTARKVASLKAIGVETVEDIVTDRDNDRLQKAERVGPVWAKRIAALAEEYVSV